MSGSPLPFVAVIYGAFFIVCQSEPETYESQHVSTYTVGGATVDAPTNVAPGESFDITATIANTGDTEWGTEATLLDYVGDEDAGGADLSLSAATPPGETGTFSGTMTAPTEEGEYALVWQPIVEGHELGTPLTLVITVGSGSGGDDSGTDDSGP